jgi:hypothetical protein
MFSYSQNEWEWYLNSTYPAGLLCTLCRVAVEESFVLPLFYSCEIILQDKDREAFNLHNIFSPYF